MKNLNKTSRTNKTNLISGGFTLIELLVVISIIGILAGLLLLNFVGVRGRAGDTKIKNDLRQMKNALRLYYNDNQFYPATADVPASGSFTDGGDVIYMKELPAEFTYNSDGDETFLLQAELDNTGDEGIADSQVRCAAEIQDYGVTATSVDYFVCQDQAYELALQG